ncbi:MAG: hypothetical protein FWH44_00405 [Methanomassiliicoccaceae archaeon]|nr:hypothetical protein [Methanomassiliicoccaceae archaeon]
MFRRKNEILDITITIGEFDPSADGAYRNVKTFPLNVRQGKLFISVNSDAPVDIALSDESGTCVKFRDSILCDTIGPLEIAKKGTMTLVIGVFRGDRAETGIRVWMG